MRGQSNAYDCEGKRAPKINMQIADLDMNKTFIPNHTIFHYLWL